MVAWGRAMVSPMLSPRTRTLLRPVFGARPPRRPWIPPAFAARITRRSAAPARWAPVPHARAAGEPPCRHQPDPHPRRRDGGPRRAHRRHRATASLLRLPRCRVRLALPPSQRSEGGAIKVVVRRALGEYLPPLVASRSRLPTRPSSRRPTSRRSKRWCPTPSPSCVWRMPAGSTAASSAHLRGHDSALQS